MPKFSGYRRPAPPLPDPSTLPFPGGLIRACDACNLRGGALAPVPGCGPAPARVMFTGEAPGQNEDLWGRPFVGKAGEQFDSLLSQAGVVRELVYVTNAVHCRPLNNATPKPAQVSACAHWLDLELGIVNPQILVPMGGTAIRRFLGDDCGTVEHLHGKPIVRQIGSATRIILPTYHPAAALHDTSLLRFLYDDFQVLRGILNGHELSEYLVADEYPNPVYRVADTPELLAKVVGQIREAGSVAVDVETIKRDSELWSIQVSTEPGTAWFIPAKLLGSGRVDTKSWGAQIIVHNYLHDIRFLDIPDNNFFDSMVAAYLTGWPQGLKELASRLCGIPMRSYSEVVRSGQRKLSIPYLTEIASREWPDPTLVEVVKWDNKAGKVITKLRHPWHISRKVKKLLADCVDNLETDPYKRWNDIEEQERVAVEKTLGPMPESSLADIPLADAVDYSCLDASATLRVKLKMDKLIHDAGLDFVLYTDCGILPMVYEMMQNGMAVDVPHFRKLSADYTVRMAGIAEKLAKTVGHAFNPASSKQVATVVYQELGFKPTGFTPSREISTDDMELKKVKHPVTAAIIRYRRLSKLKGTYADALVAQAVDGRIHTTLKTTRVETGRLASADPNLQNVPTRTKESKKIRMGFVASSGKKLAEGDYGQVEMRVLAHLSGCKRLIELFLRDGDPHTDLAATIFGKSLEEAKQSKYRYPAKTTNFGVAYLLGAQGLSNQIQEYVADLVMEGEPVDIEPWDVPTCERFLAEYYKLNPEVKDFQQEMAAMARRFGYVTDLIGRRRYIPEVSSPIRDVREGGLRMAANLPVTASAQEIIKLAMVKLHRDLVGHPWQRRSRWLLQVHDSLIVELDDDPEFIRAFLTWMGKVMTGVVKLAVPVKVDFKVGLNWAELEKWSGLPSSAEAMEGVKRCQT